MPIVVSDRPPSRPQIIACAVLVTCALLFSLVHTAMHRTAMRDLMTVQAGGAAIAEGYSPYDVSALRRALVERHGPDLTDWALQIPIYPPTSLAFFALFARLSVPAFCTLFFLAAWTACVLAAGVAFLRSPLLKDLPLWIRAFFCMWLFAAPKQMWEMISGNPVVAAVPLVLYCCFDVAPARRWLRVLAFLLAFILKPTIAAPFLLVLLLKRSDGWKTAAGSVAAVGIYTAAVLAWFASHPVLATWRSDLGREIALASSPAFSMNPSDRTRLIDHLLQLQYTVGYWITTLATRELISNLAMALLCIAFLAASVMATRRVGGRFVYLLVVAATACMTLLPVYHRFYDCLLLIAALPWAAAAIHRRVYPVAAWAVVLLNLLESRQWFSGFSGFIARHEAPHPRSVPDFLIHRMDGLAILIVTIMLTITLFQIASKAAQRPAAALDEGAEGSRGRI